MRVAHSCSQGSLKNSSLSYWHNELQPLTHVPCFPTLPLLHASTASSKDPRQPRLVHPLPWARQRRQQQIFFLPPTKSGSQQLYSSLPGSSLPPCCAVMNGGGAGDQPLLAGTVSFLSLLSGADQLQLFLCSPGKAESRGSELEHSEVYDTLKWRQGDACLFVTTCRNTAFCCKVICNGKSSWYC